MGRARPRKAAVPQRVGARPEYQSCRARIPIWALIFMPRLPSHCPLKSSPVNLLLISPPPRSALQMIPSRLSESPISKTEEKCPHVTSPLSLLPHSSKTSSSSPPPSPSSTSSSSSPPRPLSTPLTLCRTPPSPPPSTTSLRHIVFGIASSARSWPGRNRYIRAWYNPQTTRAYAFLDRIPSDNDTLAADSLLLPPVRISEDTSRFPYTFHGGLRSAIRVARIVKEIVGFDLPDVRWIVLGDDDTVFLAENLARTLGKYDWGRWFYVGGNSESLEQNLKHSFDMAFGGGGFAISYPLARVLARVLDSCLVRYSFLYGSDSRVHACLVELGVGLTRELGFHQVYMSFFFLLLVFFMTS
ncbi:putative transferase [Cinnamomum micranthum f. kanehirae]|uniref:Putative transferase n=1 Tax=Cinnamomum micranthum f. kanehirae TaxID=337451 RepID=A0A3S3NF17_9MAGN|nr:putative transferase [Cinnamomum micranthum f. kanehirae]